VIDVILRSRAPRYIYVGGQVMRPGVVTLMPMLSVGSVFQSNTGNILHGEKITLSQAILTMGGYDDATARKENVVVIRYVEGKRYAAVYDMSKDLSAEIAESVLLEPDDIVYVPRTLISEINIWVDQHINQLLPKRLWATYSGHPVRAVWRIVFASTERALLMQEPKAVRAVYFSPRQESSLRDILYVLFRHKWKILIFFVAMWVTMTFLALTAKDFFQSEAKVLVKIGRNAAADPSVTGPMLSVLTTSKAEVNSKLRFCDPDPFWQIHRREDVVYGKQQRTNDGALTKQIPGLWVWSPIYLSRIDEAAEVAPVEKAT
jgi:hypothetical protein